MKYYHQRIMLRVPVHWHPCRTTTVASLKLRVRKPNKYTLPIHTVINRRQSLRWHSHGHGAGHGHGVGTVLADDTASKESARITWIGIGVNGCFGIFKLGGGILSNSAALVADAAHSISDLVSDMITLGTVKLARKPADIKYPYGYGRFESIGALAVSGMLVATAIGAGAHSFENLIPMLEAEYSAPETDFPPMVGALIACGSIVSKEWLFRSTLKIGVANRSPVLLANAWHHRSDALSSVVVLVALGASWAGLPIIDPLSGILVSGMIMRAGFEMGLDSIRTLADHSEPDEDRTAIKACIDKLISDRIIKSAHNIRGRRLGHTSIVEMHILVDPMLTVSAAHSNAEFARQHILWSIPHVSDVLVHVDVDPEEHSLHDTVMAKTPAELEEHVVQTVLKICPEVTQVSHVRAHFVLGKLTVQLEIVVSDHTHVGEARQIASRARDALLLESYIDDVDVHLELSVDCQDRKSVV